MSDRVHFEDLSGILHLKAVHGGCIDDGSIFHISTRRHFYDPQSHVSGDSWIHSRLESESVRQQRLPNSRHCTFLT